MKKVGNTYFADSFSAKDLSFKTFEIMYKGRLKGISLEAAFKQLGGKIEKKESKKDA